MPFFSNKFQKCTLNIKTVKLCKMTQQLRSKMTQQLRSMKESNRHNLKQLHCNACIPLWGTVEHNRENIF